MADKRIDELGASGPIALNTVVPVTLDGEVVAKKATGQLIVDLVADNLTPADIAAATAAQGALADSAVQQSGSITAGHLAVFDSDGVIEDGGAVPTGTGDVVGPASAVNGHLAVFSGTSGKVVADGGEIPTAAPAGADTQVQFNDGDDFGADAGLVFDKAAGKLTVGGDVVGGRVTTEEFFGRYPGSSTIMRGSNGNTGNPGGPLFVQGGGGNQDDNDGGDLVLAPGQKSGSGADGEIKFSSGTTGKNAVLDLSALTADRTITMPDEDVTLGGSGGPIVTDSVTGETTGGLTVSGHNGDAGSSFHGTIAVAKGGDAVGGHGGTFGGQVNVVGGGGFDAGGGGGQATLAGGSGDNGADGGLVQINGGGGENGGNIYLSPGQGGGGTDGQIRFGEPNTGNFAGLDLTDLTTNRVLTIPDASGTVALQTGANFGPGLATSITVVNGIITAIS